MIPREYHKVLNILLFIGLVALIIWVAALTILAIDARQEEQTKEHNERHKLPEYITYEAYCKMMRLNSEFNHWDGKVKKMTHGYFSYEEFMDLRNKNLLIKGVGK